MKVASWNVNSLRVRLEQVEDWLKQQQPDVLCLQELKMEDKDFPVQAFEQLGYHSYFTGQKTYNGVAILSKQPLKNIITELPNFEDQQRRFIMGRLGDTTIINVYVPNGQALDSEKFVYKRQWLSSLRATIKSLLDEQKNQKLLLLGDFNITPSDLDVHDPKKWHNKIHCSPIERQILQNLMSEGLYDLFRKHNSGAEQFSWWDYRGAGYRANEGLRIDLILASEACLSASTGCTIDEAPRKLERPSDHTPVIAELDI